MFRPMSLFYDYKGGESALDSYWERNEILDLLIQTLIGAFGTFRWAPRKTGK